jgi:translation initiation factor 2 beta subunit (eIF-2beta)/eIF-5
MTLKEYNKKYYLRNKHKWNNHSDKRLLRLYNITVSDYEKLKKDQNNKCKICNKPERATQSNRIKRLAIDHCHTTGKVRGLLCHSCNVRLSFIEKYKTQINDYLRK